MTRALVVGGGIAGPVVAMALQKAGLEPVIYEAYHRLADGVGAFMNIAPNGLDALDCLDLTDVVRGAGFDTPAMAFYRHTGERLTGDIPFDRVSGRGNTTVERSDLYITLRRETERRGIRVEYDKRVVNAENDGNSVWVEFTDGSHADGDVLVGADGLHSRVRTIIDPDAPSPRYVGVLNAWGHVPSYPSTEAPAVIRMFFGRKCFFMYTQAANGELRWYANPPRPIQPNSVELRGGPAWRDELAQLFERDRGPVAEIIRATPDVPAPFLNCDLPTLHRWHRENMIVIGDAAHGASPTSGSGASIAMEDAVVLAKCLRDAPTVAQAFTTYEAARRKRVEAVVAQGKRNIEGNLRGPVRARLRDYFIARSFKGVQQRKPIWMHEHHIEWERPTAASPA
jgi:2-polyprenyl-6-methoxyphenol hydroxylase-like FAD-dependent oxidoreductase